MENYRQQAPFTVQIEPVEGCNLGCKFCGLRGMREKGTKPWYFMKTKTAEDIAKKIQAAGWTCKIIFAMHGEPTLNPELFDIVRIFRKHLPNAVFYIISNGYGIVHNDEYEIDDYVRELFRAGINHILLDNYSDHGDWSKVVTSVQDTVKVLYLGKDKTHMFPTDSKKNIIVLPPIVTTKISLVRNLKNHCGAAFPLDDSFNNKKCAVPFRELSFRYNGSVALCCDDFRGEFFVGNIKDYDSIDDLWNNERFQAARVMLYNGERSFRPCQGCSSVSMRVGLLPDQKGKDELEPISEEVRLFCQEVGKEGPLSKIIIKRPWEE